MKTFLTKHRDPSKSHLEIRVEANSWKDAQQKLIKDGYKDLKIVGELVGEVNCNNGDEELDWAIDEHEARTLGDPLHIFGGKPTYDEFCDWLEIALDEPDLGLRSLLDVKEKLLDYEHKEEAQIVQTYINKLYDIRN